MTDQRTVSTLLTEAYDKLKIADLSCAVECLEQALAADFENEETLFALACAQWWTGRFQRIGVTREPYERAEHLLSQWKPFKAFQKRYEEPYERTRYAFKQFVFGTALNWYEQAEGLNPSGSDATSIGNASLRMGRCHKGMGNYEKALGHLEEATRHRKDDPETLAELADALALVNESRAAKALFREAFFLNPQRVELGFLESTMIERLVERVAAMGLCGAELAEWLPVYGSLFGVFNVKRELKASEVSRLRQSVYELENEAKENAELRKLTVPRLLNRYFWLVDHFVSADEDRARIDEVLLKIRLLDPAIHKQYVS